MADVPRIECIDVPSGEPDDYCTGKHKYLGKVGAETSAWHLAQSLARRGEVVEAIVIYGCPNCYNFHVGTKGGDATRRFHRKGQRVRAAKMGVS